MKVFEIYFYANPMDICVLPRVGGFQLGK